MDLKILKLGTIGLLALSLTGCPPKKQIKKEETKPTEEQTNKPVEEPSLRGKDYKDVPVIGTIYFDLDQATLRADARDTLEKNYQVFKQHTDWEALVEGKAPQPAYW